jgi:hypothetical protein
MEGGDPVVVWRSFHLLLDFPVACRLSMTHRRRRDSG